MSSDKKPKIVVFGGINMNLITLSSRFPTPGETVKGSYFYTASGGKGANQAVAACKMGSDVKIIGRVGDDVFGSELITDLNTHGVDTDGISVDKANSSGVAVIILNDQRENQILATYGANANCDNREVLIAEAALMNADALMLQMETPYEISLELAKIAKKSGVNVIWDPAPPIDFPDEVYKYIDVLTPNQSEALNLTGIEVNDITSAKSAAHILHDKGVRIVIIKLGDQGAYFVTDDQEGHVPSYDLPVVNTVAAGDAFGGAFTTTFCEGKSVEQSIRYGTAAGALAITKRGVQDSMPYRKYVEELVTSR